MATKYELKKHLYDTNSMISPWQLEIGNQGPRGIVSKYNYSKQQTAKLSTIAFSVSKLIKKSLSVSRVKDHSVTYIEYRPESASIPLGTTSGSSNRNDVVRYIVDVTQAGVKVIMDEIPGIADHQKGHRLVTVVLAGILYNENFSAELKRIGYLKDEMEMKKRYDEIVQGVQKNTYESNPLFLLCDSFYYQTGVHVTVEVEEDSDQLDSIIERMEQNKTLLHDNDTPGPVKAKLKGKSSEKKAQPDLFTEPLEIFFERCKKGEFLIDYEWEKEVSNLVVPLDYLESFIPTECFRDVLLSTWYQINNVLKRMKKGAGAFEAIGKNPINIKIMGKPGTGKTTVIEAVLASLGYPKGLINCKGRMEEDEIEGQNKFVKGSIWNIPTKASIIHPVGGAIVLEEFNLPDSDILQGALGQALAYPFILKRDGHQELKRHPLTIYFATMNIGTNGTKPVNQALSSRFSEGHILEDVKEEEFVSILHGAGYTKKNCTMVYKAYMKIMNYLRQYHEELVMSVTLRHCLNALDKISIGFLKEQAYRMTFISELYANDPEVAEDILANLFSKVI